MKFEDVRVYSGRLATEDRCKKAKSAKLKLIGTHSSQFHADEVSACALLMMMKEFKRATIMRTRDAAVLNMCDIVVDVGGIYDAETRRFDHHQREFQTTWNADCTTRMSSAGLIWKHYGADIVRNRFNLPSDTPVGQGFLDFVYKVVLEQIDAVDNGINPCSCPFEFIEGGLSYPNQLSLFNLNGKSTDDTETSAFRKALGCAYNELTHALMFCITQYKLKPQGRNAPKVHQIDSNKCVIELDHPVKKLWPVESLLAERTCNVVGVIYEEPYRNCTVWRCRFLNSGQYIEEDSKELLLKSCAVHAVD